MSTKLKIAVIGIGLIGRRHIELVQNSFDCELIAVVDPMPIPVDYLTNINVPQYPDLKTLFKQCIPDGVILATPNAMHVVQAMECINSGVAALIEKPVAHSVEEGMRLHSASEQMGSRLLVGHHRTHSPILAKARDVIREGILGDLVAIQGSALFYKPDEYFDTAVWRRQQGGGPILINMIHEIGNLRSLCGEIIAVQAMQSNAARGFVVEDTVSIGLRFENGMLGTFMLSDSAGCARSWEQTSHEDISYPFYEDEDCYVISGKNGTLNVPTMRIKFFPHAKERSWWKPFENAVAEVKPLDPLEIQLEHFCQVIRGAEKPLVTVLDGVKNLVVTEAISQAASTGKIVPINLANFT
ncbi:putative dehydrogenase [Buttiauxella sp. BIGb0552]|uniref:Gfo/Idh/MocA family protein n=1 Tax=Buttiauxella sp. BIGb0552 TaxID=2485120 RepID=UPI00106576A6|nr:Gfo/Idh/MocA family oxidoreductase [Buttiauxella sp. BIGb0552]TDX13145.1 putative dehydrogenase [Buttiauxella sp. BIGb0552]